MTPAQDDTASHRSGIVLDALLRSKLVKPYSN